MLVWHAEPEVFTPYGHVDSVKRSRPRRCRWPSMSLILALYILAAFPVATLVVQSAGPSTNVSFPVFLAADDFMVFGTTWYNPDSLSFTIDPNVPADPSKRSYCLKLLHTEKVRMKSRESRAVASFSTSFTFSITLQEQSANRSGWQSEVRGFAFTIVTERITSLFQTGKIEFDMKYFQVEFDTYNSYVDEDPSDNHIGIDINNAMSVYTYNLCGGETTSCTFPWTGRTYTARIDYNGTTRALDIWFANGSRGEGAIDPALPGLIRIPELDLVDVFEDYMFVGFSGNSGSFLDTYEILSWNFNSSFAEEKPESPRFSTRVLLICAACGGTVILLSICLLGHWMRHAHGKKSPEEGLELLMGLRRFTFRELKKATHNFSDCALLGKGGSGSVYRGTLTPSRKVVAVKRLTHDPEHVQREFLAEVSSISQIRHRNLVHLQGWCHEDGHFLLVFDYMSNGSLDEWLFPRRRRCPRDPKYKKFETLPFGLRCSILAGVAAAVEYLHEEWVQCVLHRDIKSSNVLLDADFSPHLGDFGLARLIDHEKLEKTTMLAGTLGYMAPEMHFTGKATKQSDVYSFGILLLEVVCGRKAVNLQVEDPAENFLLVQNVWCAHEGGNILRAVDPGLLTVHSLLTHPICADSEIVTEHHSLRACPVVTADMTFNDGDVVRKIVPLLHLGLQCCLSDPESRPSMRVVQQAILQLQSCLAADAMTVLDSMPPLPSTMPVYGSVPPVPDVAMKATNAPLEEGGLASFRATGDTMSVLRRRFQSPDNDQD